VSSGVIGKSETRFDHLPAVCIELPSGPGTDGGENESIGRCRRRGIAVEVREITVLLIRNAVELITKAKDRGKSGADLPGVLAKERPLVLTEAAQIVCPPNPRAGKELILGVVGDSALRTPDHVFKIPLAGRV